MDRQEPVVTLRSGGFFNVCLSLDWHRRVEAGTARWWIAGFVQFSFFLDLAVNSFHSGAATVRTVTCWFGTCKWTEQRRIHGNSQDIQIRSGQWPFHPTADSSLLPMEMGSCGFVLRGEPFFQMFMPPVVHEITFFHKN